MEGIAVSYTNLKSIFHLQLTARTSPMSHSEHGLAAYQMFH
jgi:hypothetical protein